MKHAQRVIIGLERSLKYLIVPGLTLIKKQMSGNVLTDSII